MQELQEISGVRAGTAGQSAERRPHRNNRVNPPGVGLRGLGTAGITISYFNKTTAH